jgi:hypothetical protein
MENIEKFINKLPIVEKAWSVSAGKFEEPWYHDNGQVYYGTRGQAKQLAIPDNDGGKLSNGKEVDYLNIPVVRSKEYDKVDFRGEKTSKSDVRNILEKEKLYSEFDKLLEANPNGYAYILKGGYYYGPNYCGYTERQTRAGVYTLKDAISECKGVSLRDHMRPSLINVESHNESIQNEIDSLKSKLLTLQS